MDDDFDWLREYSSNYCKECEHSLEEIEVKAQQKKQRFEILPINLIVTEYPIQKKIFPDRGRLN